MDTKCERSATIDTFHGKVTVIWAGNQLRSIHLGSKDSLSVETGQIFKDFDLVNQLGDYFSGKRVGFAVALDTKDYTDFERKVWEIARLIPYGETRTYGWIAKKMGNPKAARAVGNALGRNPFPIVVPCHRVVPNKGGLGGFSAGLDWKKALLKLEGIIWLEGKEK